LVFSTRLSQRLFSVGASCGEAVDLLTGLRAKTRKKKRTGQVHKENKMTRRKQHVKNQIVISVEENAYDEKKSSRNQGGYF
jgi:uncharacterized protein YoaH (UPF0181 family)